MLEHREGGIPGFTAKYGVKHLVYYEVFEGRNGAFVRERAMKKWRRLWKVELIERVNPSWGDLFEELPLELTQKAWVPAFAGMNGMGRCRRVSGRPDRRSTR